jgi:transposase
MTKTEHAVKLVREEGMTVRQAARQVDVSETTVHAAIKKLDAQEKGLCPCCGQKMPEK